MLITVNGFAQSVDFETPEPFKFQDLEKSRNKNLNFRSESKINEADDPLQKLEYAAEEGSELAIWKLGRIYSDKQHQKVDHFRAFKMFSRLAKRHTEIDPFSHKAPFTASALVSLGGYYRQGIPETPIERNTERAWSMFLTAATYYGDSAAQYALFEMCESEDFASCSTLQATRWLKRSAINGHANAQANFGIRQFEGNKGVPRNKIEGLKWLTIARKRIHPIHYTWVQQLHEQAFSVATLEERAEAQSRADAWISNSCRNLSNC